MGTNYYWHDQPCEHCGRYETIHVGKSGHTWQGFRNVLESEENPDWGYLERSPFGFEVASLADWERVFETRPGTLWNEYGEQIKDPLDWLAGIEPISSFIRSQNAHWYGRDLVDGTCWYDSAGFFFCKRDFT